MYGVEVAVDTMLKRVHGSMDDVILILLSDSAAGALPRIMRNRITADERNFITWPGKSDEGLVIFWDKLFAQINSSSAPQIAVES